MPSWGSLIERLRARPLFPREPGSSSSKPLGDEAHLTVVAHGKSAHGGVNIEGGPECARGAGPRDGGPAPASGENDLLAFARLAGQDLHGTGLGLTESDPIWGRYLVNVATDEATARRPKLRLEIVLRRPPPRTGPQIKAYLEKVVGGVQRAHRRPR